MSRDNYGDERGGVMVTGIAIAMGNGDDDVMVMMAMIVAMVMMRRMMRHHRGAPSPGAGWELMLLAVLLAMLPR